MPHCSMKDDTYLGYTIPAGTGLYNCVCFPVLISYSLKLTWTCVGNCRLGLLTTIQKFSKIQGLSTHFDSTKPYLQVKHSTYQPIMQIDPTQLLELVVGCAQDRTSQSELYS